MNAPEARRSQLRAVLSAPALRTGLITGLLLVLVMLASLFVADRVPAFEASAWIRNDICRVLFGVVMLIPIFRFFAFPRRMFASALAGWSIFAIGYDFAGMYFHSLFASLAWTPFQAFVLGMIFYGVVAAVSWVAWMLLAATQVPLVPSRRRLHHHPHHR